MEYNAWGEPKNPPEHEANLVFTRMMSGPMDFTPGMLSLNGKNNTQILSTLAKQLALYVVIYSPIQMAADLHRELRGQPAARSSSSRTSRSTGTTRACSPARSATWRSSRARRAVRTEWFVGAVGDEQERRFDVALDFLPRGRRYRAEIYRDGDDADYRTNPRSIVIEQRNVTSADRLAMRIAPGGGAAVRFVPVR